jgi:opacity protein-like surface antigen
MVDLRGLALCAGAVIALSGAAAAADLLPPPPAVEPPPPPELGGWYLRGDVGVGVNNTVTFSTSSVIPADFSNNYYNSALSEAALFDAGVGYQVNNWFRTDFTAELRGGSSFSGLQVANQRVAPFSQFADFYRANVSTFLAMANVYADLGTWGGVTPFVGAGIGGAWNHFYAGTDASVNTINNFTGPAGGILGAATQTDLAWALMAGFDVNVTRQLKLELGYRYLNYGTFKSASSQCLSGNVNGAGSFNCNGSGYTLASHNLASNDFRLGLRYYWDTPVPEAPIVRKY